MTRRRLCTTRGSRFLTPSWPNAYICYINASQRPNAIVGDTYLTQAEIETFAAKDLLLTSDLPGVVVDTGQLNAPVGDSSTSAGPATFGGQGTLLLTSDVPEALAIVQIANAVILGAPELFPSYTVAAVEHATENPLVWVAGLTEVNYSIKHYELVANIFTVYPN